MTFGLVYTVYATAIDSYQLESGEQISAENIDVFIFWLCFWVFLIFRLTLVYAQFCESRKTSSVKRHFTGKFDKKYESEYEISI